MDVLHDEAASAEATDWPQILALYEVLEAISPGPMVTLNRAVALARVRGPEVALASLAVFVWMLIGVIRFGPWAMKRPGR